MACTKRQVFKNLIVGFAVFYALSGIVLLLVSLLVDDSMLHFQELDAHILRTVLIVSGFLALVVAAVGGIGAIKENHCMLKTFITILTLLVSAQIFHSLMSLGRSNSAKQKLESSMDEVFKNYYNMEEAKTGFDTIQQSFHCCGMYGPEDWKSLKENGSLPLSCCPNDDLNPSMSQFESEAPSCLLSYGSKVKAYEIGCFTAITQNNLKISFIFGVLGFIFVLLKILVIYFSFYLIRNKEKIDVIVVPLVVGEQRNEEYPPPYKV